MKTYMAAPPDILRVDEKNLREYSIFNCCGIIITTNHKNDGIYLPADDRRHYVAWSEATKEDARFQNGYWKRIYSYYQLGGLKHVAAYLRQRDISGLIPRPHHHEPPRSGVSSTQIVPPRKPSWPTPSTNSVTQRPSHSSNSSMLRATPASPNGSATGKTVA